MSSDGPGAGRGGGVPVPDDGARGGAVPGMPGEGVPDDGASVPDDGVPAVPVPDVPGLAHAAGMPDAPAPDEPAVELATVPTLGGLYARGLAGSARAAAARRTTVRAGDLPDTHVVVRDVRPHADHLTAYQHLLGEPGADALPAGFVHVVAFPVATAVMVRPDFPLGLLGLVHVANRVEQRRAVRLGERLDIDAHARDLRAHRAGVTVEVVADVSVGGEHVWRGISTYLAKGVRLAGARGGGHDVGVDDPHGHAWDDDSVADDGAVRDGAADDTVTGSAVHSGGVPRNAGAPDLRAEWEPPLPTGRWALGGGVGRAYAAVSGDRNPIHMSALTAKAFGFPRAIAHGMYTASRALADIGPAARGEAFTWDVTFAKPVLLPSNVNVRVAREGDVWRYDAWDSPGRRHLTGSVTPAR